MKKNIYLAVLLFLTGCQNELYKNPLDDFQSEQGVYIANNSVLQSFVEEGKDVEIKGLQVALAVQDTKEIKVTLEAGNQAQLDAYNAKNGTNLNIIRGQEETLLVLEQRVNTKALRISTSGSGSGSEDDKMFPNDFKVDQWTMEVMVNRASYKSNNRSICGTKLVANAGPMDEIYMMVKRIMYT